MKLEEKFNLVENESRRHTYIGNLGKTGCDEGLVISALEEFFWGTYDLLQKANRKKPRKKTP